MATLDYDKIINGIRKALYGYEVREYLAQSMEWTKAFVTQSVEQIKNYLRQAESARDAAKASQDAAKVSETNAKASENAAKASQNAAASSASAAAGSASAAKTSETNAKASENAAKTSETKAKTSETNAKASENAAKTSETNAKTSETNAKSSETKAATSETNAKTSETNAKASADSMGTSVATCTAKAKEAEASAGKAAASEGNAKTSEGNAKASEDEARRLVEEAKKVVNTDKTLTIDGAPADAKTVGDKLKSIKTDWNSVTDKPSTFPSTWDSVSGKPNVYPTNWDNVSGKPNVYPTNWDNVSGKPSNYPPSEHNHSAANITSGILGLARGGTGCSTALDSCNTLLWRGDLSGVSNWDTLDTGIWRTSTERWGTNGPSGVYQYGIVMVWNYSGNVTQVYIAHDTGAMAFRQRWTNHHIFSNWALVTTGSTLSAYPVGAIYISTSSTSPASLFGGTWERIASERVLMGVSSSHGAGSTVSAGLPNISGRFWSETWAPYAVSSGPYTFTVENAHDRGTNPWDGSGCRAYYVNFNASNANAIYGGSSTVQPAAYFVYMWRRIA